MDSGVEPTFLLEIQTRQRGLECTVMEVRLFEGDDWSQPKTIFKQGVALSALVSGTSADHKTICDKATVVLYASNLAVFLHGTVNVLGRKYRLRLVNGYSTTVHGITTYHYWLVKRKEAS
jgi:hypothetical protein